MARNRVFIHPRPLLVTYLLSRHQNFDLWENQKFWILKNIFFAKPTNQNPYFTQRYFHRLRALYTVQQSLFVAIIVLIYQIFLIFFLSEFNDTIIIELVLMTVLAALIWPIIFGILRQLRIKFVQSN